MLRKLLVLLVLWLPAWATTGAVEEATCPACGTQVSVTVLYTSNNAGGMDRDFLERPAGGFALLLTPATCPKCHYTVSDASLFEEPVPPELLKRLTELKLPEHQPITPNGPSRAYFTEGLDSLQSLPAWARWDLMAQQSKLVDDPVLTQALFLHRAAWSVRLEDNPFTPLAGQLSEEEWKTALQALEPDTEAGRADIEVEMARQLLAGPELSGPQATLAGFLLRTHGELSELEQALPRLVAAMRQPQLEQQVTASIAHERSYLERVLQLLEAGLETPEAEGPSRANLLYLRGELARRLGRPQVALESYRAALAAQPADWLKTWANEQAKLVGGP
ncbi:MAG: hypothetical protein AB7S38_27475 [Vulcanimicrobiota bacterium]